MEKKKKIAVLGSTGSIGTQALEAIAAHPEIFDIEVLTANQNADLLIEQALKFLPNVVVIGDDSKFKQVSDALWKDNVKVFAGKESLTQIVEMEDIDMVLNAINGYSGLEPTLATIKAKKPLALANKESLVIAGDLIIKMAQENNVPILPVDSEPSAIFQSLKGEEFNNIEKVHLTASGGPFRGMTYEQLQNVTKDQALQHPVWKMGNQITINSATLMNKGWEVIESKWLFNLKPEQIDVVVHPEAVVHSLVQFEDGSLKAQMSINDMKIPILYALSYPYRLNFGTQRFNFINYPKLQFEQPDTENFPCLQLAIDALKEGGNATCILNAANEVAVNAFLNNQIAFTDIANINNKCLHIVDRITKPSLSDYFGTYEETSSLAQSLI